MDTRAVDPERKQAWSISEPEVMALADMAVALEAKLGLGLDVEWAIGTAPSTHGEEALFALQVRPITVNPRQRASRPAPAAGGQDHDAIGRILGRLAGHEAESAQ